LQHRAVFAECNPELIPDGIGIICVKSMYVPPSDSDVQQTDGSIAAPDVRPAGADAFGAEIDYAGLVSCTANRARPLPAALRAVKALQSASGSASRRLRASPVEPRLRSMGMWFG
jgi:hypothetical protein